MRIVIAGGSGFLGRPLAERLAASGHQVVVLTRKSTSPHSPSVRSVTWDPDGDADGEWALEIDGAGAIVNLAGAGIADKRWTDERKVELKESRVLSTRSLVSAVRQAKSRPGVFIQGSAVGYYGTQAGSQELDESYPPGSDFLGELAVLWEATAHPVTALGCRLVVARSGVVLARDGGALKKLALPFKLFAGGPIASGRQYVSWIHRDDWIDLVLWALTTPTVSDAVNASAPSPVTNAEFSTAIGHALMRPSWLPVPGFALRLLVGQMAGPMLIEGQRVIPTRTQALGFRFKYPTIDEAAKQALS